MKLNKSKFIWCVFTFFVCSHFSLAQNEKLPLCKNGEPKHNCFGGFAIYGYQYSGEFQNGNPEGYGVYIFPNGDFYKGYFKNGKFNGEGEYIFYDTKESKKGNWINNRLESELIN